MLCSSDSCDHDREFILYHGDGGRRMGSSAEAGAMGIPAPTGIYSALRRHLTARVRACVHASTIIGIVYIIPMESLAGRRLGGSMVRTSSWTGLRHIEQAQETIGPYDHRVRSRNHKGQSCRELMGTNMEWQGRRALQPRDCMRRLYV